MSLFWVSWYAPGPFELNAPWWVSGERFWADDREPERSICAAILADSEDEAQAIIVAAHDDLPEEITMRFTEHKPDDWSPFSDRFVRADWMPWPPANGRLRFSDGTWHKV